MLPGAIQHRKEEHWALKKKKRGPHAPFESHARLAARPHPQARAATGCSKGPILENDVTQQHE